MKLAARLLNYLPLKRTPVAAQPSRAALPAPLMLALEPRIVYDGSAAAIGAAAAPHHADVHHTDAAPPSPAATEAAAPKNTANTVNPTGSAAPQARTDAQTNTQTDAQARTVHSLMDADATTPEKQVVFIDPSVANYQQLLAGLPAGTQYVILDSGTDGLAQIAQYLQQHPGVDAIHLISHGTDGAIQLGATWLTAADFSAYSGELAQIGAAMKPGGDFLIYGCDVAENADGKALVQEIASVSHLNVAASADTTGAAALGGNWTLEYDVGAVRTPVIFSTAAEQQFSGSLGVTVETYDGSIGFTNNGTSFTLDGITYTSDQPSQFIDTSASDGSVPLSSGTGDGALEGNADGSSAATTLQMSLQNGDNMSVQSFDLDTFGGAVELQAVNASGAVIGTLVVDASSSGVTQNPDGSYHIDLSNNVAFSGIKSLKLVETDGFSLAPTLDNFTYVDLNSPPALSATGGSTSFTEADNVASTPVAIDGGITLLDGDATTAKQATVSITGNFVTGQDVLQFSNTSAVTYGDISASYDATHGVLTLTSSGTATIAQWENALRAVAYTNTAANPNTASRTISITLTRDAFNSTSNTVTKVVTVQATDQTPIVTTTGGTTDYQAGAGATTIDTHVSVSDGNDATQASATVSISGGHQPGDTLSFTNDGSTMGDIAAQSYDASTGVLTLTASGGATNAQWAAALSAIEFSSTSTTLGNRTISFATNDGTKTSVAAIDTVDVTNPVHVTTDSGSAAFIEANNTASTPVAVDAGLTIGDTAAATLGSATIAVTGNFHAGEDVLSFTNDGATMGNIMVQSYNPATGVLTLVSASSSATSAQWQSALRSITYTDTAITPNTATRTVSFTVTDSLGNTSDAATRTVTVAATDQSPILTTTGSTTTYVAGASPKTIDSGITVSDADNTTQLSATVAITGNFHNGDTLAFTNANATLFGDIQSNYSAITGTLQLSSASGTATDVQWANALAAVTFSSASTAVPANRTISFSISDGTQTSTPKTDIVSITAPPQITTDSGSASFVSGDNTASTPVAVDSGLSLTDGAAGAFQSATIAITGNFHAGEDILSFTNDGATMGNIAASYDAATGVLTLTSTSGTATTAQWQSALDAVTYTDTAVTPSAATRTISFTASDNAGNTSNTATRTVTVTAVDQTPIVTTTGSTTDYVSGTTAITIDNGISVSDLDNPTLQSATVTISGGFQNGDVLSFTTAGSISGSYDASTGVLTMTATGGATIAQWDAALQSLNFFTSSTAAGNRTIAFALSDGTKTSAASTDTVTVLGPPRIATDPGSASFIEADNVPSSPIVVDGGLTLTDGASTTFGSATVAITGNFHSGEDVLAFTNNGSTMGNITASYDTATGLLTLSSAGATATLAQWRTALASVTYIDTAITPNTATRTISFTATDGRGVTSNSATRTVTVIATDQTPIVTSSTGTTDYRSGTDPATIDGHIGVTDTDGSQASATVSVGSGFQSGDTLAFANTDSAAFGDITASYDPAHGVLTLTSAGAATNAQWANVLSAVTFATTSTTYGERTISFATSDGTKTSAAVTDTVNVTNAMVLAPDSGSAAFVQGDNAQATPVVIGSDLMLTDTNSLASPASATIAITGNFHSGEDLLTFTNSSTQAFGDITGSYNTATGVLTLSSASGTATTAQWQSALDAVTYTDSALRPNTANRTVSFSVADKHGAASDTATRTVTVTTVDQTPSVTTSGDTTSYSAGSTPKTIDSGIMVHDLDDNTQSFATVSIGAGFANGDALGFANTSAAMFGNIAASYDAATGVLTLTSAGKTATDVQWSNALSAVTFSSAAGANGSRTIAFVINDGASSSAPANSTVDVTTAGGPGMMNSTSDNSTPPAPPETSPDALGDALSNKPSVLDELDDPQPVGTVPSVPTITFSDSNTHYPYIPGRTMVPPAVSLVPAELSTPNPSPFDLLPVVAAPAVIAVDGSGSGGGFTIDISDLDGEAFADSPDVSVSLADGKGLPAWLHYDAGKGTLSGKMPGGSPDVHVLVQVRDASGHVIRREIVLAPQGGAAGMSHMGAPHASLEPTHEPTHELVREASQRVPLPAGKPSLAHQFASARAVLHVARPAPAAALAAAHPATANHDTGGRA